MSYCVNGTPLRVRMTIVRRTLSVNQILNKFYTSSFLLRTTIAVVWIVTPCSPVIIYQPNALVHSIVNTKTCTLSLVKIY